jgi:hypothetical protein
MKRFLFIVCLFLLIAGAQIVVTSPASADADPPDDDTWVDDDTWPYTIEDSALTFDEPTNLKANTKFTFTFEVYNAAAPSGIVKPPWIREVDMQLPPGYVLAHVADQPAAPNCLHSDQYCDHWQATYDLSALTISWRNVPTQGAPQFGDIHGDETQIFSFVATADDVPSNSFPWRLWGDDGTEVEGVAVLGGFDGDDTVPGDDDADDDASADNGGDHGGCGCGC